MFGSGEKILKKQNKVKIIYGVSTPFIGEVIEKLNSVNVEAKGIVIKTN